MSHRAALGEERPPVRKAQSQRQAGARNRLETFAWAPGVVTPWRE